MTEEEAIKLLEIAKQSLKEQMPVLTKINPQKSKSLEKNALIIIEAYSMAIEALEKQIAKKPLIWEEKWYYAPSPNDEWGYECPCCGNRELDYPEHHCECGQAIDWSEE